MSRQYTPQEIKNLEYKFHELRITLASAIHLYFWFCTPKTNNLKNYRIQELKENVRRHYREFVYCNNSLPDQFTSHFKYSQDRLDNILKGIEFLENRIYDNCYINPYNIKSMFDGSEYGVACAEFMAKVYSFDDRQENIEDVKDFLEIIDNRNIESYWLYLSTMTPDWLLYLAWNIALVKPYSIDDFNTVKRLYYGLNHYFSIDLFAAEICLTFNTGGRGLIYGFIENYLKDDIYLKDAHNLNLLSSALCWMKLEKEEKLVLQYIYDCKLTIPMDEARMQRFYYLSFVPTNSWFK